MFELTDEQANDLLLLQPPKNREHGDVALGSFKLAKHLGEKPPAIAQRVASEFVVEGDPAANLVTSAQAAGPFVNFRYRRAAIAKSTVEGILQQRAPYGRAAEGVGQTILIDFSSPNIAKPFHIGHLRSTVIGAALRRIHQHVGNTVHGVNHLGDWGMPFAKMMTAFLRFGEREKLDENPMRYMFNLYREYQNKVKEDPSLDDAAAKHFQALESGEDNEERRMWQLLRDESLRAFQGPYDRLGVGFDHITGESFYEDKMDAAMKRVSDSGILETMDGAEVVNLESEGFDKECVLRKSDGTTLYHTRDLAAAFYRNETFQPDRMLYVVGAEQKLHFDQLKAVLRRMGDPLADKVEHTPFGLILSKDPETGKWSKFKSRSGDAIFLDEVLDEAVKEARAVIDEKNPDLPNAAEVAEKVGVGAIVFNDLKNSRIKDVKFDWDQMLSFDGETGPYVQYACARLSSILRKADFEDRDAASMLEGVDWSTLEDASDVLLTILDFGPAVHRAAEQNEPSVITSFVVRLAGEIHAYLRDHHVLNSEEPVRSSRLALVAAARQLLETGLGLLGVGAPRQM